MKDTAEFYDQYWKERASSDKLYYPEGSWVPLRLKIASQMVSDCFSGEKLSVLDIGCGDGTLGKLLKDKLGDNIHIFGVDISEESIIHASKFYDKTLQFNAEKQDILSLMGEEKFDVIISLEMLEHLFAPGSLLRSCKHLLRPEGFLIASFPNIAWWKYRIDLLCGNFPVGYTVFDPSEHIQNFTLKSFIALISEAGFEKQEIVADYSYPRILKKMGRFLRRYPALFGQQIVVKAKST